MIIRIVKKESKGNRQKGRKKMKREESEMKKQ
jgi:hypothetical protein